MPGREDEVHDVAAGQLVDVDPVEELARGEDLAGVRDGTPVNEDAVFGLRAAAPALACNNSYFEDRIMRWDPRTMTVLP